MSDVPHRSIWQREPVRVISAVSTFAAAINAALLGANAYDGGAAAAVTGLIAAGAILLNELFTRPEVVPVTPLRDLAEAAERKAAEPG